MTIDPIRFQQPDLRQPYDTQASLLRAENRKKAEESTSGYYATTLQSLATSHQTIDTKPALTEIKSEKEQKSLLGRAKEWLWSLFGFGKKEAETVADELENDPPAPNPESVHTPRLERPDTANDKKLSKAIADLNRELKDISEFEEEMRTASSKKMDKLIFLELVECSQRQRRIKEEGSANHYEDILALQKKNKSLQEQYFDLLDAINSSTKTTNVLHWVNVGTTVGIVASLAATFASAGLLAVVASVSTPLMALAKGATTLAQGILKYDNDLTTGELFVVGKDSKANTDKINENLSGLQSSDEEIGGLLKTIRQHLENQRRAGAIFGRSM